jgi:hypothetical protein
MKGLNVELSASYQRRSALMVGPVVDTAAWDLALAVLQLSTSATVHKGTA